MPTGQESAALDQLQSLARAPREQVEYARRLLETARNPEVALAALAVLAPREDIALRPALLSKYEYCDAKGVRRDQGGVIRVAILNALRPIVQREDVPLLERAAMTYEFLYGEAAGDLRAAALLTLNEVDDLLAAYHSVRLLEDPYTDLMSGEPAVTAVRVLASQDQSLPLYAYVIHEQTRVAEVLAESLRSLVMIPASLLPAIVEKYRECDDEIVLLGLFDLLLAHDVRAQYSGFILDFLRTTTLYNIYRYLVSLLIATHDEVLIKDLETMFKAEQDRYKSAILREAFALR